MKKTFALIICFISSFSLIGCSNMSNQDTGTIAGAVAGGLLGSQFGGGSGKLIGVGIGTLGGALIGGAIGKSMDDTDRLKMQQTLETAPVGKPAYWKNNNTNTSYMVTPVKNVTVGHNPYCREYRTTANVAGKNQQVYGTACRQPDGSWKVVN